MTDVTEATVEQIYNEIKRRGIPCGALIVGDKPERERTTQDKEYWQVTFRVPITDAPGARTRVLWRR
jgi:hypothetical protein